jgi:hypothetical protein
MRGTQAKKLRRVARQMCKPELGLHGKQFKNRAVTAFWPNGSYRRILRSMKKWFHLDPKQKRAMLDMGARV